MRVFLKNNWVDILVWALLAIILLLVIPMFYPAKLPFVYHFYNLVLCVVLFTVYYLNILIIIPNVVKRGVNFYYVILFFGICALVINLMNFIEIELDIRSLVYQSLHPNGDYSQSQKKSYVNYYLFFLTLIVMSLGYINQLFRKWNLEEQKNNELRVLKSKAELESLKAQIHPHFFFNTLNTIYALTNIDVEKAQKAILGLSKMMRYVMNEENKSFVKLAEETFFIHNYLELMEYRLSNNVKLEFQLTQKHPEAVIAPMILLNFIENCFKHGVSTENSCFIKISTDFEGEYFVLKTENDWFENRQNKNLNGIGIWNSRKRLEIIYPENYCLEHNIQNNRYYCILKIKLL